MSEKIRSARFQGGSFKAKTYSARTTNGYTEKSNVFCIVFLTVLKWVPLTKAG